MSPTSDQSGDESALDEARMGLMEHLVELRNRLMWVGLVLLSVSIVAFIFSDEIFGFLSAPLMDKMQSKGVELFGPDFEAQMIATNPTEIFWNYIKVSVYTGLLITMPWTLFQIWRFVAPGLYANEKSVVWPFLVATPVLFWTGCMLVYFVMAPLAFNFLLGFQDETTRLLPTVGQYVPLLMWLMLATGVGFQLPVLLNLLARAGLVTAKQLMSFWKYSLVGIAIMAAIFTPPDPVSQLSLGLPMVGLYFGSIWTIWLMEKASGRDSFKQEEFDYSEYEDAFADEFEKDAEDDDETAGSKP